VEYNLWLESDLNTRGHSQWYYFKVLYKDVPLRADKKFRIIKFNILNLAKTTSLYEVGMKPCIWSKKRNEADGTGWFFGTGMDGMNRMGIAFRSLKDSIHPIHPGPFSGYGPRLPPRVRTLHGWVREVPWHRAAAA
jgi:hypothetical protein